MCEDDLLVAGGGASNAVCLHRARAAGLGGFEFACAIPGTAGGGVRMNAGAYASDWAAVLERALVVDADGAGWRTPDELGLAYRHSSLRPGQVVVQVEFRLVPRPADEIKAHRRRAPGAAARRRSRRTSGRSGASSRTRSTSSRAGRMLEACGLRGHRIGGAQYLAAARELHRERRRRTSGGRSRADGRGPAASARGVRGRARARGRAIARRARSLPGRRRAAGRASAPTDARTTVGACLTAR